MSGADGSEKSESLEKCVGTERICQRRRLRRLWSRNGYSDHSAALCAHLHASMPPTGCTEGRRAAAMEGGEKAIEERKRRW